MASFQPLPLPLLPLLLPVSDAFEGKQGEPSFEGLEVSTLYFPTLTTPSLDQKYIVRMVPAAKLQAAPGHTLRIKLLLFLLGSYSALESRQSASVTVIVALGDL